MGARWAVLCFVLGLALKTASTQTVPCMETRDECQRTGFNSISIINNHYRCCAPGFSMTAVNGKCFCTKVAEVSAMACSVEACGAGGSVSTDFQGNTRCCPPGFGLSSQSSAINGMTTTTCTCTKWGGNIFVGNSGMMTGMAGDVNTTAVQQEMQAWRKRFQTNMATTMRHMTGRMQTMAAQMANQMNRMRAHMASVFGSLGRMFAG